MRASHIFIGLLIFSAFAAGCVRKTEINEAEKPVIAGKGGFTTLNITPQHHEKNIDSCIIYIKYNATKKPATNVYDETVTVTHQDGRPMAKFPGLKRGNYFIYGEGYDPDVAEPVVGGTSFTIIDTLEKSYDIYLAVSEAGGHQ